MPMKTILTNEDPIKALRHSMANESDSVKAGTNQSTTPYYGQ